MSSPKVVDFSAEPESKESRRLADLPDRVVAGDPHHEIAMHYTSPGDKIRAGTWVSTPGKWLAFADRDEFCMILSGHVILESEDGTEQIFRTGDAFLIPNGFRGWWNVIETTTKHFVIHNYS
jgi:uncharacterized cupin superfamily protein